MGHPQARWRPSANGPQAGASGSDLAYRSCRMRHTFALPTAMLGGIDDSIR